MKNFSCFILIIFVLSQCKTTKNDKESLLEGSWKMVYADSKENDSLKIKDLSTTTFIKIINKTHFAFFNQNAKNENAFYSGGGTYIFNKNNYKETLLFTNYKPIRNQKFSFTVELKNDTLIQKGVEEIKSENKKRFITEKYIKSN